MNLAWSLGEGVSLGPWDKGVLEGLRVGGGLCPAPPPLPTGGSPTASRPGEAPREMPKILRSTQEPHPGTLLYQPRLSQGGSWGWGEGSWTTGFFLFVRTSVIRPGEGPALLLI